MIVLNIAFVPLQVLQSMVQPLLNTQDPLDDPHARKNGAASVPALSGECHMYIYILYIYYTYIIHILYIYYTYMYICLFLLLSRLVVPSWDFVSDIFFVKARKQSKGPKTKTLPLFCEVE